MTGFGKLSKYFKGFGYKRLKLVEIDPAASNGHEFNGIADFRSLFGDERRVFPVRLLYLADNEDDVREERTEFTWYNARERNPTRNEYRLYYKASSIMAQADVNDLLLVAVDARSNVYDTSEQITVFIAKHGDNVERQLAWLFGFQLDNAGEQALVYDDCSQDMNFIMEMVLSKMGIVLQEEGHPSHDDVKLIDVMRQKFGSDFPASASFSEFARSLLPTVDPRDGADQALMAWMDSEETIFRLFEHDLVQQRLDEGVTSVEDFLSFSLSVQNRRKSRAGHALENHMRCLFDRLEIRYSHNAMTENKVRPDFIFPGIEEYWNQDFPVVQLSMLGVKTTCKDRWRQVLSEAQRIPEKHLLTLEPGISENQTSEMAAKHLRLVIPRQLFASYSGQQQAWLLDIDEFVHLLGRKQCRTH